MQGSRSLTVSCRLFCLGILGASVAAIYSDTTGMAHCPCIDPQLPAIAQASAAHATSCADPARPVPVVIDGGVFCYPADYGAGRCSAHDREREPECAHPNGLPKSSAPEWCSQSWCYVGAHNCKLKQETTSFIPYMPNLTFSYGTCGHADYFGDWSVATELRNRTLRIHLLDEPPFVFLDRPADHPLGQGIMFDFYKRIFELAEANYEVRPLLPYNGSAWSACVRDVSLGAIDVCIGTFWETPERRKSVEFVSSFSADNFYLVTKTVNSEEDIDVFSVMKPFTNELWALIAVTIVVVGVVIFILERRAAGEDHDDFKSPDLVEGIAQTTYLSCFGFWSGGPAHNPTTRGGKLVQIGFGVFLMLMISSYTANLASFLVVKREAAGAVSDWDAVAKSGQKVCVWESVIPVLNNRRPGAAKFARPVQSTEEAFAMLSSGECIALCNGENENKNYIAKKAHCDKLVVDKPVFSMMLSQPVNPKWGRSLSYWLVELVSRGELDRITAKYETGVDECADELANQAEDDEDSTKMGPTDFIGTFMLTYVLLGVALLYRAFRICQQPERYVSFRAKQEGTVEARSVEVMVESCCEARSKDESLQGNGGLAPSRVKRNDETVKSTVVVDPVDAQ